MKRKNFFFTSVVVFVAFQVMNFAIHSLILMKAYQSLTGVWRPDMTQKVWIVYVTSLIFSFLFVYIFSKGYEGKRCIRSPSGSYCSGSSMGSFRSSSAES